MPKIQENKPLIVGASIVGGLAMAYLLFGRGGAKGGCCGSTPTKTVTKACQCSANGGVCKCDPCECGEAEAAPAQDPVADEKAAAESAAAAKAKKLVKLSTKIEKLFAQIDADKNQTLDQNELKAAFAKNPRLARHLCQCMDSEVVDGDAAYLVTRLFDGNKDGSISFEEFSSCLVDAAFPEDKASREKEFNDAFAPLAKKLNGMFKRLDKNGDGQLDQKELESGIDSSPRLAAHLCKMAGVETNDEKRPASALLTAVFDKDNDSKVTFAEFKEALVKAAIAQAKAADEAAKAHTKAVMELAPKIDRLFSQLDADGNGVIDQDTLAEALNDNPRLSKYIFKMFGEVEEGDAASYLMYILDSNSDYLITHQEFTDACIAKLC